MERPMMINDQAMIVGASFGFAIYPRDASDAMKLLRLADQRMYGLKRKTVHPAQIPATVTAASVQQA
jgi:GGDEF domain-containing protein